MVWFILVVFGVIWNYIGVFSDVDVYIRGVESFCLEVFSMVDFIVEKLVLLLLFEYFFFKGIGKNFGINWIIVVRCIFLFFVEICIFWVVCNEVWFI